MRELNKHKLGTRVQRARSAVGKGIKYRMGHGGTHPEDNLPTRTGYCDCSGFMAWVIGINRAPKPTRPWWIETTNIYRDATGKQQTFVQIDKPVNGCFVVYGDKYVGKVKVKEGHIGLVTDCVNGLSVVDCSSSKQGKTKESIREWDRTTTFKGAIFCVLKEDFV